MEQDTKTLKLMTLTMGVLAFVGVGFFTTATVFADETYYFVNAEGELEAETADMPMEAINEADDIAYNSGVITAEAYAELTGETVMTDDSDDDAYLYVDAEGNLDAEDADTAMAALNEADDIRFNSGVIEAEAYFELRSDSEATTNTSDKDLFYYVNAEGELEAETADMPMEAINEADDIAYNSGVITAEAYAELSQ